MEILVGLILLAFVIAMRVSLTNAVTRIDLLEGLLSKQKDKVEDLTGRVLRLQADLAARPAGAAPIAPPVVEPPLRTTVAPIAPPALIVPPAAAAPPTPVAPPAPARVAIPLPTVSSLPVSDPKPSAEPRRAPAPEVTPAKPPFDWESLIGVKAFPAIAGISLLIAAVFFLKIAVEHGYLGPPVRVAIGLLTAITLLVVCELKAARKYPATANAMDASAIAILFSTFFAAHSLWDLIPAAPTFLLLGLVAAVAVLLSIRRDSLFIAVLGLIGGFLTPALLSTGENRPVALFSYLLLLNAGLAWVAYRKRWPALTVLSAILTTLYQWNWVLTFLHQSSLTLAMGIFLLFPVVAMAGLMMGNPRRDSADATATMFERAGLMATALPLTFGLYLAAIPEYGAQAGLLFGFLLIVDAGLFAIALARTEERLHALGALSTLLVVALWLGTSYTPSAWTTALLCMALFVVFYLVAPWIAERLGRPMSADGAKAVYAAPFLLFAFAALARTEEAGTSPLALFATLFALAGLVSWRAIAARIGGLYFSAAFFVLAALGVWSAIHLVPEAQNTAMGLYGVYGVFALCVPVLARKFGRPLEPPQGAGIVLFTGLGLLLFLAWHPGPSSAIWGFAVLLSILNAALFIESAATRMPALTITGGLLSWIVLGTWWSRAVDTVGLLPSLLLVVGLALIMLAGHAWAHAMARDAPDPGPGNAMKPARFRDGLFLALVGHLFLLDIAAAPALSLPPWALFGALVVLTLAMSVVALFTRVGALHAAGVAAAGLVVFEWSTKAASGPWPLIALVAAGLVSAFGLSWIAASRRRMGADRATAIGAVVALFAAELTAIAASLQPGEPGVVALIVTHVLTLTAILALSWRGQWAWVAPGAIVPAAFAMTAFHERHPDPASWFGLLALSSALYAVFALYPFVLGRRVRESRDPHIALVLASGVFLLAAREALKQGGLSVYVGAVPVIESAVLALLLRRLLALEAPGSRDLGRLALVAGAAMAFITVAIPLQLDKQWITLGWALEGAALAWLSTRIPHKGLVYVSGALLAVVFARLALNPEVLIYEPRGAIRIFNWYLYTYGICGVALIAAGRWLRAAATGATRQAPLAGLLQAGGVVVLFLLLNIEIADFYSEGPEILFRFGATLAQDLTYTICWLLFGLTLLAAGIVARHHGARIAALALIAVTTFKCFLFDLSKLEGLFRVASFVGLAVSLALVSILLQKYVLAPGRADPKS